MQIEWLLCFLAGGVIGAAAGGGACWYAASRQLKRTRGTRYESVSHGS